MLQYLDYLLIFCMVALHQELYKSFMKQRPLRSPLGYYEPFRNLSPAEDAVCAERLVIFCADVFQFCFGVCETNARRHGERWHTLKGYEGKLTTLLPTSFESTYYRPPVAENG